MPEITKQHTISGVYTEHDIKLLIVADLQQTHGVTVSPSDITVRVSGGTRAYDPYDHSHLKDCCTIEPVVFQGFAVSRTTEA